MMIVFVLTGIRGKNNMINKQIIRNQIYSILECNGINSIEKAQISSLTYITLICELESKFNIEFPDEVLTTNVFSDLEYLERIILFLIGNKNAEN